MEKIKLENPLVAKYEEERTLQNTLEKQKTGESNKDNVILSPKLQQVADEIAGKVELEATEMNIMNQNLDLESDETINRLEVNKNTEVGYKTIEAINSQVKGRTPNLQQRKEELRKPERKKSIDTELDD